MRSKSSKWTIVRYIWGIGILLCLANIDISAQCKEIDREKVKSAINSIFANKTLSKVSASLRDIGTPAVPCVLEYMSRDGYKRPVIKIILLDFVSKSEGAVAEDALIALLKDQQPELRGYAVFELGSEKYSVQYHRLLSD